MWTADKRPLGCKLELGLDVQNPAKRCNFSDIQFSDVVRVPRLQVGLGLDIQNLAKRCNFSDTFRTLFGHFSDIPGSKARRHPKLGLEHLEHTEYATSEIRWAKRCNFSDQILSKSQKPPKVED